MAERLSNRWQIQDKLGMGRPWHRLVHFSTLEGWMEGSSGRGDRADQGTRYETHSPFFPAAMSPLSSLGRS